MSRRSKFDSAHCEIFGGAALGLALFDMRRSINAMTMSYAPIVSIALLFTVVPSSLADGFAGGFREALGPRFDALANVRIVPTPRPNAAPFNAGATLRYWNQIAINASGLDHTPVAPGETRVFGEQFGPGRSSRAMAIVHIAIFDAVNAIAGAYKSYSNVANVSPDAAMNAAIAQAAHDTLAALYPSQKQSFDTILADDLRLMLPRGRPHADGIALGARAAAAILELRANDGSEHAEGRMGDTYAPSSDPGFWRQDPIGLSPLALGYHWGAVKPFVLQSGDQFRVPPPPALSSVEYATAYAEVKNVGGDGIVTPTERSAEQTEIGIYWAYDGTPSLCAPPRLYNQIATTIAAQMRTDVVDLARLLALVNVAMADAGTAIWESKYWYEFWRPVTGIRESDPGTGPTGAGDGNSATDGDLLFTPLGAPASNLHGPNFTPPFPSYPSGHAGFGGALFQTLRNFYETDAIPFAFVSDEFNGTTLDHDGNVRPLVPRSFSSLSQAEEENGQSRIYLGIHWSFDKTQGIAQGRKVADYVFANAFAPQATR
jgi:PAP2 superfamily